MKAETRHPGDSALESVASGLAVLFLRQKLDSGGVVEILSLNSVMFKTPGGEYVLRELERPDDIPETIWNRLDFKHRRSELISRRAMALVGKVPVAEIEEMIRNELGPFPPDFSLS